MNPIKRFENFMIKYKWKNIEENIFMLNYIRNKEGDKLDKLLLEILEKIEDPKYSTTINLNGLSALINHNFLNSAVAYHKFLKARRFLEKSKNKNEEN